MFKYTAKTNGENTILRWKSSLKNYSKNFYMFSSYKPKGISFLLGCCTRQWFRLTFTQIKLLIGLEGNILSSKKKLLISEVNLKRFVLSLWRKCSYASHCRKLWRVEHVNLITSQKKNRHKCWATCHCKHDFLSADNMLCDENECRTNVFIEPIF